MDDYILVQIVDSYRLNFSSKFLRFVNHAPGARCYGLSVTLTENYTLPSLQLDLCTCAGLRLWRGHFLNMCLRHYYPDESRIILQ